MWSLWTWAVWRKASMLRMWWLARSYHSHAAPMTAAMPSGHAGGGANTQVENSHLNVLDLDETSSSLLERMLAVQDCMVPGMLSSDRVQVLHRTSAFDDPTQCISGPVSAPSGFRETTNSHHSAQLYRVLAERFYDVAACAKHGICLCLCLSLCICICSLREAR